VVTAYEQAMAEGTGAISVGDRMIDMASVRMAQMILQEAEGK
jgi:citrate lyase beta subunit